MPMDGTMNFLTCLESKLSESIPARTMSDVLKITADVLADYDVTQINQEEKDDDELLKYYLSVLNVQGLSQKTIDRYQYIISRMMQAVRMPTRKITVYHLRSYLGAEKERGISDNTLKGYREIFSAYFNWLQKESLIDRNPTVNLGKIKVPKKQKEVFSDIDMERLHRSCSCLRDRAIISFLDSTACRISEMVELDRSQIDFQQKRTIVHGKGDKERPVVLTDVAAMLLKEYLDTRKDDNPALFVSERGANRLKAGGVRLRLNAIAEKAGVDHVHPHKFRRSKATRMARHNVPLQIIQKYLGHEKPDTTMQYVMINNDDIEDAVRRCV